MDIFNIADDSEPQSEVAKVKPSLIIRAGRGRTGGSTGLDLVIQRARFQGRRVKPLDGDRRSKTLSTLYPYKQRRQSVPLNRLICVFYGGAKVYRSC